MHDLVGVEILEALENLLGDRREEGLGHLAALFEPTLAERLKCYSRIDSGLISFLKAP